MKRETWEKPEFAQSREARQNFMAEYSCVPVALLGNLMEREAYLDRLFPSVVSATPLPNKKQHKLASRN